MSEYFHRPFINDVIYELEEMAEGSIYITKHEKGGVGGKWA